jgi:hypothetical protein
MALRFLSFMLPDLFLKVFAQRVPAGICMKFGVLQHFVHPATIHMHTSIPAPHRWLSRVSSAARLRSPKRFKSSGSPGGGANQKVVVSAMRCSCDMADASSRQAAAPS